MAFGSNNKQKIQDQQAELRDLRAELDEFRQAFLAGDARLDGYGPKLAELFAGEVTSHDSGRSVATTVVDDVWSVQVINTPGSAQAVFTALVHDIPGHRIPFNHGLGADVTAREFERLEQWIEAAKTGKFIDQNRHNQRASALADLVPTPKS